MAADGGSGILEVLQALGIVAGVAAFAGVYSFFGKIEDIASPKAKQDIAAWLKRAEIPGSLVNWPRQFAALFDRVFSEHHFSSDCFARSCLASTVTTVIIAIIWILLRPDDSARFLTSFYGQSSSVTVINRTYLGFFIVLSFIPDYISLLKSRYFRHIMSRKSYVLVHVILFVIDGLSSVSIWFLVVLFEFGLIVLAVDFGTTRLINMLPFDAQSLRDQVDIMVHKDSMFFIIIELFEWMTNVFVHSLTLSLPPDRSGLIVPYAVFLYATLMTSVWVWLYALAAGLVRLVLRFNPVLQRLKWLLDIDGKPIRSIGLVAGLIAAVVWWGVILAVEAEGTPSPDLAANSPSTEIRACRCRSPVTGTNDREDPELDGQPAARLTVEFAPFRCSGEARAQRKQPGALRTRSFALLDRRSGRVWAGAPSIIDDLRCREIPLIATTQLLPGAARV